MEALTPLNRDVDRVKPGDFALCFYCGAVMTFIDDMEGCRLTTAAELTDLSIHHIETFRTIAKAQSAIFSRLKAPPSDRKAPQRT